MDRIRHDMQPLRKSFGSLLLAISGVIWGVHPAQAAVNTIVHYRLGENDPGAAHNGSLTSPTQPLTGTRVLVPYNTPVYWTNVSSTAQERIGSQIAVRFNGSNEYLSNAVVTTVANNFGIEAWVRPVSTNATARCIAYNGNSSTSGWGLFLDGAVFRGRVGTTFVGSGNAATNTWTHIALVRAGNTSRLYVNGVASGSSTTSNPGTPGTGFTIGAHPQSPLGEFFHGDVDELRVFTFSSGQFSTDDLLVNNRAFTLDPSGISPVAANLNGRADPAGSTSEAWFQWGTTTNYGNLTTTTNLGADAGFTNFTIALTGLVPLTEYHFRTVISNGLGTHFGFDKTFETPAGYATVSIPDILGVDSGSVSWLDYDNDDRLDLIVMGRTNGVSSAYTRLYRNTPGGFVHEPVEGLPGLAVGHVAVADYDNDGRVDFLITGTSDGGVSGTLSQIWRNTGTGFSNVTAQVAPTLPAVSQSAVSWLDFDNDGRMDFIISGIAGPGNFITQIWKNHGSAFSNVTSVVAPAMPGVHVGSVPAADYDNDGWTDFMLTGNALSGRTAQIWRNTGGAFENVTAAVAPELPPVFLSATAWGDFDNDGDLDFILTGESSTGRVAQVWRNIGATFTNLPIPGLGGFSYSAVSWADQNNDGLLDFIVAGATPAGSRCQWWLNTGSGFTNANANLPGIFSFSSGAVAPGDYDNDGLLDVFITGTSGSGRLAQLWKNYGTVTNTPPPAPSAPASGVTNGVVTLNWTAPNDTQSGSNLTYNLRIGTSPGGGDVVGPASANGGFRRMAAFGNQQLGTSAQYSLPPGLYHWSVQAVDGALAGGPFTSEGSFEIVDAVPPTLKIAGSGTSVTISWEPASPGWILQERTSLESGTWNNSPSGSQNPVVRPATGDTLFFRLHHP